MTVSATLWNDLIAQVRFNHPQWVRGWFSDLELQNIDHGVLQIRARNAAQVRYLERNCRPVFAEAAQAATGRLVAVSFAADDDSGLAPVGGLSATDSHIAFNPDCTFEHFVTGPCNRLAHAAAVAVSEHPGTAYNPLFIYGSVGSGKTHLLQAVCHALRRNCPEAQVLYISCEGFLSHFIEAVEQGALNQLRSVYRAVDALVIDDIQFLAERERGQEELFHTFNALHQSKRQIILSANCLPSEIPGMEERLVSRFSSGVVALLDRPCLDTRMAILRSKAKLRCVEVPDEVIQFVGSCSGSNIREIEGALLKLDALSHSHGRGITLELAREALVEKNGRGVSIAAILETVARRFNLKVSDLQSRKRSQDVTYPRHLSMYLARELTPLSLEQIGGYFGGRDHTTVLHAHRTISGLAGIDTSLRGLLAEVTQEVRDAVL